MAAPWKGSPLPASRQRRLVAAPPRSSHSQGQRNYTGRSRSCLSHCHRFHGGRLPALLRLVDCARERGGAKWSQALAGVLRHSVVRAPVTSAASRPAERTVLPEQGHQRQPRASLGRWNRRGAPVAGCRCQTTAQPARSRATGRWLAGRAAVAVKKPRCWLGAGRAALVASKRQPAVSLPGWLYNPGSPAGVVRLTPPPRPAWCQQSRRPPGPYLTRHRCANGWWWLLPVVASGTSHDDTPCRPSSLRAACVPELTRTPPPSPPDWRQAEGWFAASNAHSLGCCCCC